MRSPRTPKLHLPSRVAQICWFTSQPYVRDVRQRSTYLTFYALFGHPAELSSRRLKVSAASLLQAGDELGHDLCCWLWLPGERNALSGPQ